ncbi:MAG: hypothetical protein AB7W47_12075 [Calditrichaceae bacterium]
MEGTKDMIGLPTGSQDDYQKFIELLRTRLNILNASVFLLQDTLDCEDNKTNGYIKRINNELERIRTMIIDFPERTRGENHK